MQECFALLIEEKLSMLLILLKIFPNLRGYELFKEGVKRIINDKDKKNNVGINLYQELADDYDLKLDLVDRAMRHCLDVSFKRNGIVDFEKNCCVRFSCVKPRPKEVLCLLAEKVVLDVSKELENLKK
ncbi:MAG: hypothetical protein E7379_02385 [Clostridiales bacterium]|nr:hypothetical protein [Clostridiales bacterium]